LRFQFQQSPIISNFNGYEEYKIHPNSSSSTFDTDQLYRSLYLKTTNYEEALVVEATITNELKHQVVKLSKTYRLEETAPTTVSDAVVVISDNLGNDYPFAEINGVYLSVNEFQAQPNAIYHLKIITDDGKTYESSNETLTHINPIQDVVPTVVTKDGVKGVQMVVNSFDPTNSSKYYRFEYEETNKIVAPKWVPVKGIGTFTYGPNGALSGSINLVPRTTEARVCFNTKNQIKLLSQAPMICRKIALLFLFDSLKVPITLLPTVTALWLRNTFKT